jgi:hypothetical protein
MKPSGEITMPEPLASDLGAPEERWTRRLATEGSIRSATEETVCE